MMENVDLLIVGTGMHGIAMAKTYIEVHPDATILLVDSADTIGGTWALERLYPGLRTNNVLGSYEFSDFPMIPERYSAVPGTHIPGHVVHEYLKDVAVHYGLDTRCRLRTFFQAASPNEDGTWSVQLRGVASGDSVTQVIAKRIVVAAGLTSEPNMPKIQGQDSFRGCMIHSKQLKESTSELAACKKIVVLGGNKSAWDVCYNAARRGSQVTMVMRPSGGGPSYLWPRAFMWGPWHTSLAKLSSSRFFMAFDPTSFGTVGPMSWWSSFLHSNIFGAILCNIFWKFLDRKIRSLTNYRSHSELAKLEPWTTPFWMGNSLSIHNYDTDWFQLVREGKIKVCLEEIDHLSSTKVILRNGEELEADGLVCCTGWSSRSTCEFENSEGSRCKLAEADVELAKSSVFRRVKYLQTLGRRTGNAPEHHYRATGLVNAASNHLYRFVIPWQSECLMRKNLAFIGAHSSIHAVLVAQVQALWITAFFDNNIPSLRPSTINQEEVRYEAIMQGVYGAIRRPRECGGAGDKHADLVFDSIPYIDCLLKDLGMRVNRKSGMFATAFASHGPRDYTGLAQEYKAKHTSLRQRGGG